MAEAAWDPREFQTLIREFLDRRGWSQNQLAMATGISQAVINRWMQPAYGPSPAGLVQPTDATLRKLAPVIGIQHGELMRLAGRLAEDARPRRPNELETLIADIEAGYHAMEHEPEERSVRIDVVRSIFNVHIARRPRRRRSTGPDTSEQSLVA